ncbi:MAG: hypothetical protein FJW68_07350 [Actinobacteria bacterium]|nr:hypothetical protein [Actinomycetota bacterium]
MEPQVLKALALTSIAGLSTTVGSLMGLIFKRENPKFMSFVLDFAAGIMFGVSFFEMLPWGFEKIGFLKAGISFLAGFIFIFLIDYFVPHEYSGHRETINENTIKKLLRTGLFLAFGIAIHNFPEGMATFYSSIVDVKKGAAIAIAISIHNIPEGIAVSVPVNKATGSGRKAFLWFFLSVCCRTGCPVSQALTATSIELDAALLK